MHLKILLMRQGMLSAGTVWAAALLGARICGLTSILVGVGIACECYLDFSGTFDASLLGIWIFATLTAALAASLGLCGVAVGGVLGATIGVVQGVLGEILNAGDEVFTP